VSQTSRVLHEGVTYWRITLTVPALFEKSLLEEKCMIWGLFLVGVALYTRAKAKQRLRDNNLSQTSETSAAGHPSDHTTTVISVYDRTRTTLRKFQQTANALLFVNDTRKQQIQEFSYGEYTDGLSKIDAEINHYLKVALLSLGLSVIGALVYPPLSLLSALGVLYTTSRFMKDAYKSLFEEHRVRICVVDVIMIPAVLLLGYFFVSSLTTCLVLLSQKLILKTEDRSLKQLGNLFAQQSRFVWVQRDQVELEIPFEDLQIGETVVVGAGEMIPIDGLIADGIASIDQHVLTGESQPFEKGQGDRVFASTVVLSGKIYITVENTGSDTIAARIVAILDRTADYRTTLRSRGIELADRAALPTLVLGAVGLPLVGTYGAVTLLTSSFGHNMRFLAPLTMLNFLSITSQNGILIKDGRSLELLRDIDTIVFDKTGTLTLEEPHLGDIHTSNGLSENDLLTYAATAEYRQTHPIARAILQEAARRGLHLPEIDEAQYDIGYGIKVSVSSHWIRIGSAQFMELEGIAIPLTIAARQADAHAQGYSLVYLAVDDHLGGAMELHPTIRPEAEQIIRRLRQDNMSIYIISGDQEAPTRKLAEELGIDHYFAETLPEHKAQLIEQLQKEGKRVCFVGDGINDAIAMKRADVSISLRGAAIAATDTAQIILLDKSLHQLGYLFDVAREFDSNMHRNLLTSVVPGFIIVGGVFFLNFRIISALIFTNLGLFSGLFNAMSPLIEHQTQE
jgi:heavy metal translocating P-type ATPase